MQTLPHANDSAMLSILSDCGLGAIYHTPDATIVAVNQTANRLLHGNDTLVGKRLTQVCPQLCLLDSPAPYICVAFGEYIVRCPAPSAHSPDLQLVLFRDATSEVRSEMLTTVLNRIGESVILCDSENRIYGLNDAAIKMDSLVEQDVLGAKICSVYQNNDGSELLIPATIRDQRPRINHRQYYTTRYGKDVNILANNYPVLKDNQVLGGFSVMKDWSEMDQLHAQIIELQDKLTERSTARSKGKSALTAKYQFDDILHRNEVMHHVLTQCRQVSHSESSVLFYGETGTGKELFAHSIHNASRRANQPFLAINCAAIPENLLESLLFGTEKGAYTGAECRAGLFEQASGGTLLLDELNSMPMNLQSKLLRVLQDGNIRRVGGMHETHVDVRLISNLNIPPQQAIAEGKLRRDLFYRLGVVNISIPPLRERKEDIALLAKHFIIKYNEKLGRMVQNIESPALDQFYAYNWPGNVRELQHAIEHALNVLPECATAIGLQDIPVHILHATAAVPTKQPLTAMPVFTQPPSHSKMAPATPIPPQPPQPLHQSMHDIERQSVCQALYTHHGNISAAARALDISRQNLQYRIKRYGIDIPELLRKRGESL